MLIYRSAEMKQEDTSNLFGGEGRQTPFAKMEFLNYNCTMALTRDAIPLRF